jgi:hypothetical protein
MEKKGKNQNAKSSVKRNRMKPALGFNTALKNHSDALHKSQGFKIISSNSHGLLKLKQYKTTLC